MPKRPRFFKLNLRFINLVFDCCPMRVQGDSSIQSSNSRSSLNVSLSVRAQRSALEAATKQRLEFVHTGFYSSAPVSMRARISVHLLICCCNCKRDGG